MTDCVHRSLFTTNIHRFFVTEGRFKPHAPHTIYSTEFHQLPWDDCNFFRFAATLSDLAKGEFEVRLELYDEKIDLEYAVWTENQKGKLLKGSKDKFTANCAISLDCSIETMFVCARVRTVVCQFCDELNNVRIKANLMVEEPTVATESEIDDDPFADW
ncbi:hypothetical protein M3Y94_00652500 [Aphelenchoides besseyi]|nr:hypothetical protein M3Y94_00652500 [Aphelenchoides besseyi]KAI6231151.1 hypothetical protein M3Y95_00351100 [Aphelenchoides besseyi]